MYVTLYGSLLPHSPSLTLAGCLDSLVYYKKLLKSLLTSIADSDEAATRPETDTIDQDCLTMLKRLEEIDSMRKARYRDLGELFSSVRAIR